MIGPYSCLVVEVMVKSILHFLLSYVQCTMFSELLYKFLPLPLLFLLYFLSKYTTVIVIVNCKLVLAVLQLSIGCFIVIYTSSVQY